MAPREMYRFRGRVRPEEGVRASVLTPEVEAGVAMMRLYDPIDSWGGEWGVSAKEFADSLAALPDDTSEIRLHLNSPGGEVWEGIAIVNMLRNHKARVVAVVDGLAASAASVVACAADETIMGRNSQLMIHDAWGLCIGNRDDMQNTSDRLDKISDNLASVYAAKAGGTVEQWRNAMLAETWYSAEEAVEQGLADRVEAAPEPKDKATFDLSMFRNAGRSEAPAPELIDTATPVAEASPEPDEATASEPVPTPALQERRHRMNARRMAGSTPAV